MSLSIKNEKINAKFDLVSPLTKVMQSQFDDVKESLVENGLVAEGLTNDQLASAIDEGCENIKPENIRSGIQIGAVKGKIVSKLEDIDLNECDVKPNLDFNSTFYASNGVDGYGSYASSNTGLYHINLLTGEITKIYDEGGQWSYWFEDSKGNIYVSSGSSTSTGILYLKGKDVQKIYLNLSHYSKHYEDDNGNVYISGRTETYAKNGIIYLKDNTAMQIYDIGNDYKFMKTSKGELYAYATSLGDLVYITGTVVTKILSVSNAINLFEASNGTVYITGGNIGISTLEGTTVTEIFSKDNGTYWYEFYESKNGKIYASGGNSTLSSNGLLMIDGTNVTKIYNSGRWKNFTETLNGDIYASALSNGYGDMGILKISDNEAELVYDNGYGYYLFLTSKGNIYANVQNTYYKDFICIKDGVANVIETGVSSPYYYAYWFEDSKCNVYAFNSYTKINILHFNDLVCTKLVSVEKSYKNFNETDKGVLVNNSQYVNPESTLYLLDGTSSYKVKIKEV